MNGENNGFIWGVTKIDRRLDPYLAGVITPAGINHSGLFATATASKGKAWARDFIKRNKP